MRVLLTNDDSIHSAALQRLAHSLMEKKWEVYVAAPQTEQSGVGRSCCLRGKISVEPFNELGCTAWAVNGTPLDCVNLAISHWLIGKRPDIVISGINWGVNTSIPMIFSSGTVGGAIEGVAFGIPSIAVSQCLPEQDKQYIQKRIDYLAHKGLMDSIDIAVEKTVQYADVIARSTESVVHNINFPYPLRSETEEEMSTLSNIMHGEGAPYPVYCSLYEKQGNEYRFAIKQDLSITPPPGSDIDVILRKKISHSIVDLKCLCASKRG